MKHRKLKVAIILCTLLWTAVAMAHATDVEDVSRDDAIYRDVVRAHSYGITKGVSEHTFRFAPQRGITRGEFITMLSRMHILYTGAQIEGGGSWYEAHMAWAEEAGLLFWNESEQSMAHAPLLRKQMAVIIYRYFNAYDLRGYFPPVAVIGAPRDVDEISAWARDAMWGVYYIGNGILPGIWEDTNLYFRPQVHVSRADALSSAMRMARFML